MGKIPVYRKDTGKRVDVPEHWVGHKVLGQPFRKTPPATAPSGGDISEDSTIAELRDYATEHGIDLGGATLKADIYQAITAAPSPGDNPQKES